MGAPVIYIGPRPSHVTEIFEQLQDALPWVSVQHGEAEILAQEIRRLAVEADGARRVLAADAAAAFSKGTLLPKILKELPDVVLMDIKLPGMSGIECVAKIKKAAPDLQIIKGTSGNWG